jgi:hypothetical protein
MADDYGAPIAYAALVEGTPVFSSDGAQIGLLERVLADERTDIFDGIVVDTPDGDRFVDAPQVGRLYERAVILGITAEEATALPEPQPAPAVIDVEPDISIDVEPGVAGDGLIDRLRHLGKRLYWRATGRYQAKSRD